MRRLQVAASGRWYIALTLGLGVVALATANNVLYLIESLLLSGLILSGVLSERIIASAEIQVERLSAIAGERCRDRIRVRNRAHYPLFCVEIGEWQGKRFVPIAYLPRIDRHATITIPSQRVYPRRGTEDWEGLAIATSYPFGFARKIRVLPARGRRLVWPARDPRARGASPGSDGTPARRTGQFPVEGEIRPYVQGDDYRDIVWTLSARGPDPLVRHRRAEDHEPIVLLDTRTEPGEGFESLVRGVARHFHSLDEISTTGVLTLVDAEGRRTLRGKRRILDELATVQARRSRA